MNLGDCAVLLSAWVLGPLYGGAAAGVGSMLAAASIPENIVQGALGLVTATIVHSPLAHSRALDRFFTDRPRRGAC